MLEKLTHADFEPLLTATFRLTSGTGAVVELVLIQADKLPVRTARGAPPPAREPFALLFRGPREFVLPQCVYPLEQDALGPLELFLVPIGPGPHGQQYEAIFT